MRICRKGVSFNVFMRFGKAVPDCSCNLVVYDCTMIIFVKSVPDVMHDLAYLRQRMGNSD